MKRVIFLFFILLCIAGLSYGQNVMYVNTDNLIVRDLPEKNYVVSIILHAPCRVEIDDYDDYYTKMKSVTGAYFEIRLFYKDSLTGISHQVGGWVQKKYLVNKLNKITVPKVDTTNLLAFTDVDLIPYIGSGEDNPNKNNRYSFPYPKYKGGDISITKVSGKAFGSGSSARKYYRGPRGGCFYYNSQGNKVYVDRSLCN